MADVIESRSRAHSPISYAESIRASMGKVEGYPVSQARMIRPYFHPFLLMLHLGFASHRPVSISPDAVWLMICSGFAIHAEVRGEALQRKMFPQGRDGKVTIEVRRDDFKKGSNNDWEAVFGEFVARMDGIMANDLKETLTGRFSTTGAKEKAAFDVAFMKTMQASNMAVGHPVVLTTQTWRCGGSVMRHVWRTRQIC